MEAKKYLSRRNAIKASTLGILGLSLPPLIYANINNTGHDKLHVTESIPEHFPNIDPGIIEKVVGRSHFDLEGVKKLVEERPELARSVWEWRFGDFESAIGAASHVGRRDIALYLMSKGARPTLFTFAMLGVFEAVRSTIEFAPGIQRNTGPHGISLLSHAYAGERMKNKMTIEEIDNLNKTIEFLESLGDADGEKYLNVSSEEQKKYLGDYKYGNGEKEGFTISINMRKLLSLGAIGEFGGALYKIGENKFTYNGAPSVTVSFNFQNRRVKSLKIVDPTVTVVAEKI